jgi:hypothetical protein
MGCRSMRAFEQFANQNRDFWANVKLISEQIGYTNRKTGLLRSYTYSEIIESLREANLRFDHLHHEGKLTTFGQQVLDYLEARRDLIQTKIIPNLMNRTEAKKEFDTLRRRVQPKCNLPMNKQKGTKRHHAYLTGIVNMLTEEALGGVKFDDDPRGLTVFTENKKPIRTFSRRMDGAYPNIIDPVAVWQIKEYYGTTTFGSRVADAVYETMLDGEQIIELKEKTGRNVLHYLIVDDRFTWADLGKSYLCRLIDILNEGFVNEVLFGREVLTEWPNIVRQWS